MLTIYFPLLGVTEKQIFHEMYEPLKEDNIVNMKIKTLHMISILFLELGRNKTVSSMSPKANNS